MTLLNTLKSYQESNSHQILEQHTRNVVELLGVDFSSLQTTEPETAPLLSAHQQEKDFEARLQGLAGPSCDKISANTTPPTPKQSAFINAILERFKKHNPDFVKGFEGYIVGFIVRKNVTLIKNILATLIGTFIMVIGYLLAGSFLQGSLMVSLSSIPSNLLQGIISMLIGIPIASYLLNIKYIKSFKQLFN